MSNNDQYSDFKFSPGYSVNMSIMICGKILPQKWLNGCKKNKISNQWPVRGKG